MEMELDGGEKRVGWSTKNLTRQRSFNKEMIRTGKYIYTTNMRPTGRISCSVFKFTFKEETFILHRFYIRSHTQQKLLIETPWLIRSTLKTKPDVHLIQEFLDDLS